MKRITLFFGIICSSLVLFAQDNLQTYTPSILFDKGEWEFKSFQNLYTQTRAFSDGGGISTEQTSEKSQVFFTSINQFLYGINDQINIGFDAWVRYTSLPFGEERESQLGLSQLGPKIKIAPFKNARRLSIQSSYLFAIVDDQENRAANADPQFFFFSHDRDTWLTEFFWDKPISNEFQLFFKQAFWYAIVHDSFRENNYWETQTSLFFSYFPNTRWTLYAMSEYFPTHYNFNEQSGEPFHSYFFQSGIGTKYQIIPGLLEGELLYTNLWLGSEGGGAGQTFNLGLRLIRQ